MSKFFNKILNFSSSEQLPKVRWIKLLKPRNIILLLSCIIVMCFMQLNKKLPPNYSFSKISVWRQYCLDQTENKIAESFFCIAITRSIFPMYHYTVHHFPWIAYTHKCLIFWHNYQCWYVMVLHYPQFDVDHWCFSKNPPGNTRISNKSAFY